MAGQVFFTFISQNCNIVLRNELRNKSNLKNHLGGLYLEIFQSTFPHRSFGQDSKHPYPLVGGQFGFEEPQPVAWFFLVLYGCVITSMPSISSGLEGSKPVSCLPPAAVLVVPIRANEPNGTFAWACVEKERWPGWSPPGQRSFLRVPGSGMPLPFLNSRPAFPGSPRRSQ